MDNPINNTDNISQSENKGISNFSKALIVISVILSIGVIGLLIYAFQLRTDKESLKKENDRQVVENESTKKENEAIVAEKESIEKELSALKQSIGKPSYFTNYLPVKYLQGKSQELGQSFRLSTPQNISGITLKGSYGAGNKIKVSLFELADAANLRSGKMIAEGSFIASNIEKEKDFSVPFISPVTLNANQDYAFVVSSVDNKTEADIAFAESDIDQAGKMYVYTRLSGGNGEILDANHSWQSRHGQDVLYRLNFTN
jgi:hypothetical protein